MAYRATDKTRNKKAAARSNLLKAAHKLVARQGFSSTSIQQIAEQAGLATGSVYRHFPGKSELFSEVFCQATQVEVDQVRQAISNPGHCLERLEHGIRHFAIRALQGRQLAWSLIAEPVDPKVEEERLRYRQRYAHLFTELLEEGIKQQQIPHQDTHIASAAIVGVISEGLVGPLGQLLQRKGHLSNAFSSSPDTSSSNFLTPAQYEQHLIDSIVRFCLQAVSAKEYKNNE